MESGFVLWGFLGSIVLAAGIAIGTMLLTNHFRRRRRRGLQIAVTFAGIVLFAVVIYYGMVFALIVGLG